MAIQLLLVDDHRIIRDGIKAILRESQEFQIMGEADSGIDAIRICREKSPEIILMAIALPGLNGIEATIEILRHSPETKVVILSMYDDEHWVISAIRAGARAFVLKNSSDSDLLDALRAVAKGGCYLSPPISQHLVQRVRRGEGESKATSPLLAELSPRELQVLHLVAAGKSSKEIAAMLILGLQTVRSYRKTMMKKLGVHNVAGLTQIVFTPPNTK